MKRMLCAIVLFTLTACDVLPADLPPGDITAPQYWGDFFLDKYELEREEFNTNIEPGPTPIAQPRTVLLVTGVTIPAEWFEGIRIRLERDGFNTIVYEPADLLSYDLFEASQDLADVVEEIRLQTGEDQIDILAECTGGLIARHYVQSMGGDRYINRIVTFVSPQNGVALAPKAAKFVPWPALRGLSPGSEFLRSVQNVPLPETVDMTSIYACDDEYIRPIHTSIVDGATNIDLCDDPTFDGQFIGHFRTMFDRDVYQIMFDALVKPLSFAPEETDEVETDVDDVDDVDVDGFDPDVDDRADTLGQTDIDGDLDEPDVDSAGCSTADPRPENGLWGLLLLLGFVARRRR